METDGEQQRAQLRRRVIAERDALTATQLRDAASALCRLLASTPEYGAATRMALYWPVKGEADVRPIIDRALAEGKGVYLPVVGDDGLLRFAPYDPGMPMKPNRLRIPEPDVPAEALLQAHAMELVIMPLTVFDRFGNRLGMGGGYYDRTFAFLREEPGRDWPVLAGAAHELQRAARLPTCPWDVPAHLVVTDQRIWRPVRAGDPGVEAVS